MYAWGKSDKRLQAVFDLPKKEKPSSRRFKWVGALWQSDVFLNRDVLPMRPR